MSDMKQAHISDCIKILHDELLVTRNDRMIIEDVGDFEAHFSGEGRFSGSRRGFCS